MPARQQTPTPIRTATVHRLPATGRGRAALLSRRAAFYVLPPSDGTLSEWQSWSSEERICWRCEKQTYQRLHLVLASPHGMYTFMWLCSTATCRQVDVQWCIARQHVIDAGTQLRGWVSVPEGHGAWQRWLDAQERRRDAAAPFANLPRPIDSRGGYRRGGGDRGA